MIEPHFGPRSILDCSNCAAEDENHAGQPAGTCTRAHMTHNLPRPHTQPPKTGADFGEGDATKRFSAKRGRDSVKRGRDSENEGFGKDFHRKGSSVKRSGPFSEPPDSEN